MKITIDTAKKTITLLEQIDLVELILFLEGENIAQWKIIPHTVTKTEYVTVPYYPQPLKTNFPYVVDFPKYDYTVITSSTSCASSNDLLNK